MTGQYQAVALALDRARAQWQRRRVVGLCSIVGCALCGLLFGLGIALERGLVRSGGAATGLLLIVVVAAFAVLVLGLRLSGRAPKPVAVAAALERVDPRFQDRLNTLLFLNEDKAETGARCFARPIALQTADVLTQKTPPSPYHDRAWLIWLTAFLVTAAALLVFAVRFAPWQRLAGSPGTMAGASIQAHPQIQPIPPPTNTPAQNDKWGEVRILEPGGDLKVTKVDVVPMKIEVAANSDLDQVRWFSSVNGAAEKPHDLPKSGQCTSAVFQPTMYLDELALSDWDVVTYYAKAKTADQSSYASDIYFLEVRPFREDILKSSGGEGASAYQGLSEMSSLIGRQQHVIRDTHQAIQRPPAGESMRAQVRTNLSEAESELAAAAQHLYADLAANLEDQPIGDALENLARGQGLLQQASQVLPQDLLQAQEPERAALACLVAARKVFQQAISQNPPNLSPTGREPSAPIADSSQKLNQMAEFRDEAKSAEEFVQRTLARQKEIEQQAGAAPEHASEIAASEGRLNRELESFSSEHPHPFQGAQTDLGKARESLRRAEALFQMGKMGGLAAARQATQDLEGLQRGLRRQSAAQHLAEAYRLKRIIEEQARLLGTGAQAPDPDLGQLERAAETAQAAMAQLGKNLENDPANAGFGQPLRDLLGRKAQDRFAEAISQLLQAGAADERRQRAAAAQALLQRLTKAFDASEPPVLQQARQTDSLRADPQSGLQQGLTELKSLLKQIESGRNISTADGIKQRRQALAQLEAGLRGSLNQTPDAAPLLGMLESVTSDDQPLSMVQLKGLIEQLQRFSVETASGLGATLDKSELLHVQLEGLPPRYRDRIQTYFQKLSE